METRGGHSGLIKDGTRFASLVERVDRRVDRAQANRFATDCASWALVTMTFAAAT